MRYAGRDDCSGPQLATAHVKTCVRASTADCRCLSGFGNDRVYRGRLRPRRPGRPPAPSVTGVLLCQRAPACTPA